MNRNHSLHKYPAAIPAATLLLAALALDARADAVTDWSDRSADIVVEARLGTPPAISVLALVQTAVHDALHAVDRRPARAGTGPAPSVDAGVAPASRGTLLRLLPAQQASIDAAYRAALERIDDGAARSAGIAAGEEAAVAVLAQDPVTCFIRIQCTASRISRLALFFLSSCFLERAGISPSAPTTSSTGKSRSSRTR